MVSVPSSASSLAPGEAFERVESATFALAAGNERQAERLCRQVLAHDPRHLSALEVLARALWRMRRYDELLPIVRRAVSENPYEPGYRTMLAIAYQEAGRYADAQREYEAAASLTGEEPAAAVVLGETQAELAESLARCDARFGAAYAQDRVVAAAKLGLRLPPTAEITAVRTELQPAPRFTDLRPS